MRRPSLVLFGAVVGGIACLVARADSVAGLCGWIVDLRGNVGGIWPAMIAGLSPLLPSGPGAGWVEADTSQRYYYVSQPGVASLSLPPTSTQQRRTIELLRLTKSYAVADSTLPMAILQSSNTGSAGELLLMMLRAPNRAVRTFGTPTAGVTSQPYTYVFHDGASLLVTAGLMFDRQLRTYYQRTTGGAIVPDQTTSQPSTPPSEYVPGVASDGAIDAAVSWLNTQASCRAPARTRSTAGRWATSATSPRAGIGDSGAEFLSVRTSRTASIDSRLRRW